MQMAAEQAPRLRSKPTTTTNLQESLRNLELCFILGNSWPTINDSVATTKNPQNEQTILHEKSKFYAFAKHTQRRLGSTGVAARAAMGKHTGPALREDHSIAHFR